MPLLTLNDMQLVEPDLIIRPVAPLVAASENTIWLRLKRIVFTYVNADNSVAIYVD